MAKVLKNYKPLKESLEEYPLVEIRYNDEVFKDLPICEVDFGVELKRPVLYSHDGRTQTAVEYEWLAARLAQLKRFCLKANTDGTLYEVPEPEATLRVRLPLDTNIEQLRLENGHIIRVADQPSPKEA